MTEAFQGGATEGEVRDWVGHHDPRIVERYRHLRQRAAKQTMARLTFLDGKVGDVAGGQNSAASAAGGEAIASSTEAANGSREIDGPNGSAPR